MHTYILGNGALCGTYCISMYIDVITYGSTYIVICTHICFSTIVSVLKMYRCTYVHTDVHTYIHPSVHTYIHTYIHTYVLTYIHTYIRTYIRTYIHTYIHTYIRTLPVAWSFVMLFPGVWELWKNCMLLTSSCMHGADQQPRIRHIQKVITYMSFQSSHHFK